ncbi:MAG: hypothetical protein FD151_420 [bacterium]|nr:MAG: hypothetical protein FD151_420 [bacterium]
MGWAYNNLLCLMDSRDDEGIEQESGVRSEMLVIHISMVVVGLLMIGWGFWAAYYARRPFNIIGAVFTPVGLIVALLGVLLICVPGFFSS